MSWVWLLLGLPGHGLLWGSLLVCVVSYHPWLQCRGRQHQLPFGYISSGSWCYGYLCICQCLSLLCPYGDHLISIYGDHWYPYMEITWSIYGDHRYPYMEITWYPYMEIHVQCGYMAVLVDHCALWRSLIEICVFGDVGILGSYNCTSFKHSNGRGSSWGHRYKSELSIAKVSASNRTRYLFFHKLVS